MADWMKGEWMIGEWQKERIRGEGRTSLGQKVECGRCTGITIGATWSEVGCAPFA